MTLAVIFQEAGKTADRFPQIIFVRQENQAEMVRMRPVEAGALDQQHLFLLQQFGDESLVVLDRINLRVKLREHVQRRLRLDTSHPGDGRNQFVRDIALAAQAPAFLDQVIDALITAQGGLDAVLARRIGAQAHRSKHVETFDVILGMPLVARHYQPAGTIAAGAVILRQAVEGNGQHVIGQRGDRRMLDIIVEHLVIHLISIDDQVMLTGDLDDFLQQLVRIQGAGRVVRVDDDDGLGLRRNLAADIVQVRIPAVVLIAQVMLWGAAGKTDASCPQGIVGGGNEHFVTGVEQGVHRHHDQLGNTVTDVDILQRHTLDTLLLGVVHDRLARREDPLGVRITGRIGQVADDVLLNFLRRIEAERGQVADVQLDDLVALFLHLLGLLQHGAADVVADVGEFGGFLDLFHERGPSGRYPAAISQTTEPQKV